MKSLNFSDKIYPINYEFQITNYELKEMAKSTQSITNFKLRITNERKWQNLPDEIITSRAFHWVGRIVMIFILDIFVVLPKEAIIPNFIIRNS